MAGKSLKRGWMMALVALPLVVLFQNCSGPLSFNNTEEKSSSTESGGGNDHGYGGKVFVDYGDCGGQTAIRNQIELSVDGMKARFNIESCAPSQRQITGFRVLSTSNALSYADTIYLESSVASADPVVRGDQLLSTFIRVGYKTALQREPSVQEVGNLAASYSPAGGQGCLWVASTIIRGQDSMTLQESMQPADRSMLIIRTLLDRDGTPAEIANWTERTGFTWQQIYDDVLATSEMSGRCRSYSLEP